MHTLGCKTQFARSMSINRTPIPYTILEHIQLWLQSEVYVIAVQRCCNAYRMMLFNKLIDTWEFSSSAQYELSKYKVTVS